MVVFRDMQGFVADLRVTGGAERFDSPRLHFGIWETLKTLELSQMPTEEAFPRSCWEKKAISKHLSAQ